LPLLTEVSAIDDALSMYRMHGSNAVGAMGVDIPSVRAAASSMESETEGVNRRLGALVDDANVLRLERNLDYQQKRFLLSALTSERRRSLGTQYLRLVRLLATDDLYNRMQKVLGVVSYGVAVVLPSSTRHRWLGYTLGYNPWKQRLRRFLRSGEPSALADEPRGIRATE
jgi:hypothetical protein